MGVEEERRPARGSWHQISLVPLWPWALANDRIEMCWIRGFGDNSILRREGADYGVIIYTRSEVPVRNSLAVAAVHRSAIRTARSVLAYSIYV